MKYPPEYFELFKERSELTLGLMALCHCNHISPPGRPKTWAKNDDIPWPALRKRIAALNEQIASYDA